MKDKWNVKLYKLKLKHQLQMYKLRRQYDFRAKIATDVKLDHYLVNTRKDIRSEDDAARDYLDERLTYKSYYDG